VRLGFTVPHMGALAGPDSLAQVARRAEEVGFDGLWVAERSLYPLEPAAPYPAGDVLPEAFKTNLDPLDALTYVAAQTTRIGLGTSIINLPWYSPVLLARRLTTLDVLSNGRLRVGLGLGWSPDEYEAAGVPWERRLRARPKTRS
jgi:alkanesulfonate monooxygenase SsuD/methylene tetrahydromethanopterin reductase-like flavin-dependent oxidoreductase (luciferase family)